MKSYKIIVFSLILALPGILLCNSEIETQINAADEDTLQHFPEPSNSSHNMSVLILNLEGVEVSEHSELACITEDNIIAGAIVLTGEAPWGMAVWGDEALTQEVEGFEDGEPLRFKYWDAAQNWELDLVVTAHDSDLVYRANGFITIDVMVGVNDSPPQTPYEFDISGVFPNPFNSSTHIEYHVSNPGMVDLSVYDVTGGLIGAIETGMKNPGIHSIEFDGGELNSGTYFLVLSQGGNRTFKKISILR